MSENWFVRENPFLQDEISSYKDLIVWQKAVSFSVAIYDVTKSFPKQELFGVTSQMRRASVSIASNIAEGCGRTTTKEYLQFLKVSLGSGFEIETQLLIANKLQYCSDQQYQQLQEYLTVIIKMLQKLISSLKRKLAV